MSLYEEIEKTFKSLKAWRYTGSQYMAGHDLTTPEGKKWYENHKDILRKAGGLATFKQDRKKYGKDIFVEPVWGTPDEYSFEHDLDYLHAEDCRVEGDHAKADHLEFQADLKYIRKVSEFIKKDGQRRAEFDALNDDDKKKALSCFLVIIQKIFADYSKFENSPFHDDVKQEFQENNLYERLNDWNKENSILNKSGKDMKEEEDKDEKKGSKEPLDAVRKDRRCLAPRVGHGSEGLPCMVLLGEDGVCQYHG